MIGMVLTFSMTWVIDLTFAGVSWFVFVVLLIIFFLFREKFDRNWGHISQAILFHQGLNTCRQPILMNTAFCNLSFIINLSNLDSK